jgi:hypothetical protein
MPAQQRVWRDEERAPPLTRATSAGGRQERSINGAQRGSADLATQHRKFVAQHHDLAILVCP